MNFMRYDKKFFLISSLLISFIFIFSLASVSAADFYVNETGGNDGNEGTIARPLESVKKAVEKTNAENGNNKIIIKGGIYTGTKNNQIVINRSVDIYSAKYYYNDNKYGDVVIDGGKTNWLFKIQNNTNVNFYGINFVNANSNDHGSVINSYTNNSNLTINKCSFINTNTNSNSGSYIYGGVIYIYGGNLNILSSNFINNTVNGTVIHGGVIYASNFVNFKVLNSSFINNSINATSISGNEIKGGVIYVKNVSKFNVSGSSFINTKVICNVIYGSVINVDNPVSFGNVTYSRFINTNSSTDIHQIYGKLYCDYNWWGTNNVFNVANLASPAKLNNYYTMKISSIISNNSLSVGDKLRFTYSFVLNGTDDDADAANNFPFFDVGIYINDIFWKDIDGRLSASYNIPLTSLNNSIKAILDKENSTILYNANKATTNIVINVISSAYYGQTVIFKAILSDQAGNLLGGKTIRLNIGGLILNLKTNSKGEASYSYLANKFIGSKNIIADFTGDSLYNGVSKNITLNVVKAKTTIVISNFKALYKKSNIIKATIKGQNGKVLAGKVVKLYINGKYITKAKSSSSGLASFKYTFKTRKTHKIIANFTGDSYYLAKNSPTLKVIPKSKTYTKLSKFAAKYGKITTFKATLKNTANKAMVKKYIKFYANDKYLGQAKTNSNGLAILSKKISFKGLVSFIAKYLGDSKNHESIYTQKVTIK